MAQAQTQIRHSALFHRFADHALFLDQPGVFLFLPNVHRPAHDPKRVIAIQRGDLFSGIQLHSIIFVPIFLEERAKYSGMLYDFMLQDQDLHTSLFTVSVSVAQ